MPIVSRPDFLPQLPSWSRKALFALTLSGICFAFAFPVLWLILTSLRPESGVYYVHRGTEFTLGNFAEVLRDDRIVEVFCPQDYKKGGVVLPKAIRHAWLASRLAPRRHDYRQGITKRRE